MRKILLLGLLTLLAASGSAQSHWPQLTVRDLRGRTHPLTAYAAERGVTLFVVWKTCCPNNIELIDELHQVWSASDRDRWPVRVVLVSLDDQRTASRVRPLVSANGWGWEVIMDRNGDMARTYNIIMPPQWVACDPTGRELFRSKVTNGSLDAAIYYRELINTLKSQKP